MEVEKGMDIEIAEGEGDSQNKVAHPEGTTSFFRTCVNGINALSGVGIVSIPYALSEGGWLSLMFFFSVAGLCYYTALLLQRCMNTDTDPLVRSYPDIGQYAFGRTGRLTISAFMCLELYLVAVEFLILEADNLHKLFPNAYVHLGGIKIGGEQMFVIFSALIILPTTWLRNLGLLAYLSFGGVLASFVLVCCVFWVGAIDGVGFHERGSLWRWSGLPTTLSLYTFCYCGHAIFPTLCNSMKDRSRFPKVLLICFAVSTATYGSMAVLGYLMFGENLTSQITLNLPTIKFCSKFAIYTTLINPITKYAIAIAPITRAIEDTLPSTNNRIASTVIGTVLVISTVIVALFVPFFGYVMTFIGAFLSVTICILFPCLCYVKIMKTYQRCGKELIFIILILMVGMLVLVLGTYVSLANIIKHVKSVTMTYEVYKNCTRTVRVSPHIV